MHLSQDCTLAVDAAAARQMADVLAAAFGSGQAVPGVPLVAAMRLAADAAALVSWRADAAGDRLYLHESQTIRTRRPLSAGETLSASFEAQLSDNSAGFSMTAADAEGAPAVQLTTRLRRGTPALLLAARAGMRAAPDPAPGAHAFLSAPLTPELIAAYADAAGDHNPLHVDLELTQALGLPERIVHGMLLAGLAEPALAAAGVPGRLAELRVRFLAPVHAGERVRLVVTPQPAAGKARVLVAVENGPIACIADAVTGA